jgi:hypothetical protein
MTVVTDVKRCLLLEPNDGSRGAIDCKKMLHTGSETGEQRTLDYKVLYHSDVWNVRIATSVQLAVGAAAAIEGRSVIHGVIRCSSFDAEFNIIACVEEVVTIFENAVENLQRHPRRLTQSLTDGELWRGV